MALKQIGVQVDTAAWQEFLSRHRHGGASARIREWISEFLDNSSPDLLGRESTHDQIKAACRDALLETMPEICQQCMAKRLSPWADE